jgi:hypothetical protein
MTQIAILGNVANTYYSATEINLGVGDYRRERTKKAGPFLTLPLLFKNSWSLRGTKLASPF